MREGEIIVKEDGSGRKREHTIVKCDSCTQSFPKPTRFIGRSKKNCCSKECRIALRTTKIELTCDLCGVKFIRTPSSMRYSKSGLYFCCRKHKETAQTLEVGILKAAHYKNGFYNYRAIGFGAHGHTCEWCNNPITAILEVHHIDGNRQNNKTNNLIVLCPTCHWLSTKKLVRIGERQPIITDEKWKSQILEHFKGPW